jgi:hypothetical protein
MACRQPTERHGGNAGIDEEVTAMVSSGSVSLDGWLAQAEELLQEQRVQSLSPSSTGPWNDAKRESIIAFATLEQVLADMTNLLSWICSQMSPATLMGPPLRHEHETTSSPIRSGRT